MLAESLIVIEDEPDILEMIQYNLRREGYQVQGSRNGAEGLKLVREKLPDLVLLDLMLPGLDGIELCRRMKQESATQRIPVIMVTAKGQESDIAHGLDIGADDYVVKPFAPKVLMARVRAVLRRGSLKDDESARSRLVRGPLVIDAIRHEVQLDDVPLTLTPTEFRLLQRLALHPGRVFTRQQLLDHAVAEYAAVIERNIDVHVRALRKKLGPRRTLIETIHGVGYRFKDLLE